MKDVVITKEMAVRAILHGACDAPCIGLKISSMSTSDLIWAEDKKLFSPEEIGKAGLTLPIWVLSGGDGDGYGGYGYGDGGDGDGYGGYGYGDGYGDGGGDGYGDGGGNGYGDGDGGDGYGGGGYGYGGNGYGGGNGYKNLKKLIDS